jgi:hypothetical protein
MTMDEPPTAQRTFNSALKFWRACPTRRCRRARRCLGDAERCRALFWPVVPDEIKAWWGALKEARRRRRSLRQSARAAAAAAAAAALRVRSLRALQGMNNGTR